MDGVIYWEPVCGSRPFWDNSLVWNTTSPDLPACFQDTVLIWAPCAFLWLFLPLKLFLVFKSPYRRIPWTILNLTKILLCLVLCVVDVVQLVSPGPWSLDDYSTIWRFCTMDLACVLIWLDTYFGVVSSAILSIFWTLSCIVNLFTFSSNLTYFAMDETTYVLNMIRFPLLFAQMILSVLADSLPCYAMAPYKIENLTKAEKSSYLSNIFFLWYDRLALNGYRRTLKVAELGELPIQMSTNSVVYRFDRKLEAVILKSKHKRIKSYQDFGSAKLLMDEGVTKIPMLKNYLFKSLLREFGMKFLLVMAFKLSGDGISYLSPLIMDRLIKFIPSGEPIWHGIIYSFLLGILTYLEAILVSHTTITASVIALKVRASLMSYVFRKAMKLSTNAKAETTVGQIVNLMAVDVMKISLCIEMIAYAFALPFQLSIAVFELWLYLGPSALVCLVFIAVFQSVSIYVARVSQRAQFIYMKLKDKRIKMMNQVLSGVKVLKLYAWEKPFSDYVNRFRLKELKQLTKIGYLTSFNTIIWGSSSITVSLSMFAVFILSSEQNVFDASTAFVTLTIFNILRRPLFIIPNIISTIIEAKVSFSRLNEFSWKDELKFDDVTLIPNHKYAVEIKNASFSWTSENNVCLKGISLRIQPHQLVAVVGSVGSGKSSFISAILGEMIKIKGEIIRQSECIGYAPQIPWIQNATLRDNILFGKPFDEILYQEVLEACALLPDLDILAAGDQTEIGEKGINLSGGQKQRISLARAVYTKSPIYFLDDTLSAVDNHVGKHIFESLIGPNGLLSGKTRILVTNSLVYASQADQVVVLSNGMIAEIGTYQELLDKKGILNDLIETFATSGKAQDNDDSGSSVSDVSKGSKHEENKAVELVMKTMKKDSSKVQTKDGGTLIKTEGMAVGKISYKIYWIYFKAYGLQAISLLLGLVFSYAFFAGSSIWLSIWSNDKPTADVQQNIELRNLRLGVYGGLGAAYVIFMSVWMLSLVKGAIRSSTSFHLNMLTTVFRAPQSFFDTTPTGRILNRFSSDIDTIDLPLPGMLRPMFNFIAQTATGLLIIIIQMPWFTLIAIPVLILFYFIQKFYIGGGRQLRRFESTTRSPIYSIFSESIAGISTIRAFRVERMFYHQLTQEINKNINCGYLTFIAQQWLALRLEFLGSLLLIIAGVLAVYQRESFTPSIVALVISYTITSIANFKILFRSVSVVETNMVSVERVLSYTSTEVPQEGNWESKNCPPSNWPQRGSITFTNYKTKYRDELENVLRGISLKIRPGEKIGIAGRTGAGKSSLTLALFRIVESTEGSIVIDDVDISTIGLHELRSRMTIIPQDPVLFSGTLRFNLDPFNVNTDDELWTALEQAHLKSFVVSLPDGLQYEVNEGGENLSVGQRQLVCLARALLRKSKILVLDEATAAVDLETDCLIQVIVRQVFADCTIVTIAHRLNTIVDYDRIVVLDKGVVKECKSVKALLADPSSDFYQLAKEEGLV